MISPPVRAARKAKSSARRVSMVAPSLFFAALASWSSSPPKRVTCRVGDWMRAGPCASAARENRSSRASCFMSTSDRIIAAKRTARRRGGRLRTKLLLEAHRAEATGGVDPVALDEVVAVAEGDVGAVARDGAERPSTLVGVLHAARVIPG